MTLEAVRLPGARRDVYVSPGTVFVPVAPEVIEELGGDWSEPVQFRFGRPENGAVELWLRTFGHEDEQRVSRPAAGTAEEPPPPIPWNEATAIGRYRSGLLLDYNGSSDAVMYARSIEPDGIEVRYYCPAPSRGFQVGVDRERRLWRHEPKEAQRG